MTAGLFAWVSVNGRLYPERLPADSPFNDVPRVRAVATHPLTVEEMTMPLDWLMAKYPAPKVEEQPKAKLGA